MASEKSPAYEAFYAKIGAAKEGLTNADYLAEPAQLFGGNH
jgi:hypothetical protein